MVYYEDKEILIRDMMPNDARIITCEEIAQGWDQTIDKYEMRLQHQADGKCAALVAEYKGSVAGYVHVYPDSENGSFAKRGYSEIVDFGVLEKYRNNGIGSKLMDIAEQIASKYSNTVYLGVGLHSGYGSAQRMYVKRGYIPDGSGVWYGDRACPQYADCCNDDDLILYLSKEFGYRETMHMQEIIYNAVKNWELDHLEAIYEHSTKGVFSAESKHFGPVILKVNQNKTQLEAEYQMLAQLSGTSSCKVYAYDGSAGLLLEERIFPGTVLRREASLEKRIQMFLQVFHEIHMPADSGTTYLNWLEGICEYCARHHVAEDMTSRAHSFCVEMFEKYPDRVLLHGDLHHDNLLLRTDGSYAMIDPKGVVGPAIMDLPRYILNELDTDYNCSDKQHMEEVIRRLSEQSGYPMTDIGKLFYMETVLENIWRVEDGEEMNRREIELAETLICGGLTKESGRMSE